jgi:hypothetical protein
MTPIGRGIAGPDDSRPVLRLSALQPSPGPCGSTCCQWRDGGCKSPTCPRNAPTLPKSQQEAALRQFVAAHPRLHTPSATADLCTACGMTQMELLELPASDADCPGMPRANAADFGPLAVQMQHRWEAERTRFSERYFVALDLDGTWRQLTQRQWEEARLKRERLAALAENATKNNALLRHLVSGFRGDRVILDDVEASPLAADQQRAATRAHFEARVLQHAENAFLRKGRIG